MAVSVIPAREQVLQRASDVRRPRLRATSSKATYEGTGPGAYPLRNSSLAEAASATAPSGAIRYRSRREPCNAVRVQLLQFH